MARYFDHTGKKYHLLTVIGFSHRTDRRKIHWKYKCDCGVEKTIESSKLGIQKSCGCQSKLITSKIKRIHGLSKSRIYNIWNGMMMRCYNPKRAAYKNYGGRGIFVCKRWHTFKNFLADMLPSYIEDLSLERKNVNKGYYKKNCKWIPLKEQSLNRRKTIRLVVDGKSKSASEWAKITGQNVFSIYARIKKGWSDKKCVYGGTTVRRFSPDEKELINDLANSGVSMRQIAKKLNTSHSTICYIIAQYPFSKANER